MYLRAKIATKAPKNRVWSDFVRKWTKMAENNLIWWDLKVQHLLKYESFPDVSAPQTCALKRCLKSPIGWFQIVPWVCSSSIHPFKVNSHYNLLKKVRFDEVIQRVTGILLMTSGMVLGVDGHTLLRNTVWPHRLLISLQEKKCHDTKHVCLSKHGGFARGNCTTESFQEKVASNLPIDLPQHKY